MATKPAKPAPLGTVVDDIWKEREKLRELGAQAKVVEEKIADMEQQLLTRLEAEGLDQARGTKATVSIGSTVVANVKDWDAFWSFIMKKKLTHLLQRRVSDPAYRELLEMKVKVPGVEPFTKKKLGVRSI